MVLRFMSGGLQVWSWLSKGLPGSQTVLRPFEVAGVLPGGASVTAAAGGINAANVANAANHSSGIGSEGFHAQFNVPSWAEGAANVIPTVIDPEAKDAQVVCPGYRASNIIKNDLGFAATLSLAGKPCNVYGNDVPALNFSVEYQSEDRLSVRILPALLDVKNSSYASNSSYFILSEDLVPRPQADVDASSSIAKNDLNFTWTNDPTFAFTVYRISTGDAIFDTAGTKLVYEDQFIEFVSALPPNYNLYGLGESIHSFRLGNNYTRTLHNADVGDVIDANIYGTHPFYLDTRYYQVEPSPSTKKTLVTSETTDANADYVSYSHGVFNRNAHAQEVLLRPTNITWRMLGGTVDLYFYAGPTPAKVTEQYETSTVGLPALQQYFTFGFHQCRWGYGSWSELQDVVDGYRNRSIPLENIWADIDYMQGYRDFTTNPDNWGYDDGEKFVDSLHAIGQHFIPIIDAAIYIPDPNDASDTYPTFDHGNDSDVFMRNPDGSLYVGSVWPGYTVFPDWQAENANEWWLNEIVNWRKKLEYDGAWIDMNEVSSFCIGSCGSKDRTLHPVQVSRRQSIESRAVVDGPPERADLANAAEVPLGSFASASQVFAAYVKPTPATSSTSYLRTTPTPGLRNINYPPYTINTFEGDLAVHAVSPNATHQNGMKEYDIHNLFGYQILNATYHALLAAIPGKRPFIIGRSTFAGSGRVAGHWGGDNGSIWAHMYFSISQALSFSLFGIPMFGVDTCGFGGDSSEELCNRWMQLSAFFPFYRNHNAVWGSSQEAFVWDSVADAARTAINIRYLLLPYMYTLFYHAHASGDTVMRALAWEFPNDPSLAKAETQFFLGPALLVTPVLAEGATTVGAVFPGIGRGTTIYYDWYNHTAVAASPGQNVTINAPLGHIPLFIRGGYIIPTQQPANVTREARRNPWGLIAALNLNGTASGDLYIDDGESLEQVNGTLQVQLTATSTSLRASPQGSYQDTNPLSNVTILGVPSPSTHSISNGTTVTFNGRALPRDDVLYNATSGSLYITGLEKSTRSGAWKDGGWVLRWE